jgi:glycosyltransferase involved in cell wall biosynthesis
MNPLITLAIPTCNRAALLRQTLECVARQSYQPIEILVSDNASTDDTPQVVAEMIRGCRSIRYRRNLVQTPLIPHFNQCLAEARGEFFLLLSDDDCISENFVEELAGRLMASRRITVAVPANIIIDEEGDVITRLPPAPYETAEGIDFIIAWLWKKIDLPVANLVTVMARTEAMRQLRYQPFPNGLNSDNLLFLQLALSGQVAFCPQATFYWRVHHRQQASQTCARTISRAGREFQKFISRDWTVQRLIRSHHPAQQKLVRIGVRRMVAEAYLHNIGFFIRPWSWRTLRALITYRPNFAYLRLVIRHYSRAVRELLPGKPMSPAGS